jgi:branched-chain amino acid transport system substrate-binding protein
MTFSRSAKSLAIAALSIGLGVSAHASDPVKIGVIEPLTGAFAASGNYVTNGAKIAADEINAAGGVLGRRIELVVEDNKSNPTEAATVAEKLIIRDKVPVLMGAWGSSLTLAVLPKLQEYKVPMLVETSAATKITTQRNPYVFRIAPTSVMEADYFKDRIASFNLKKVDFLVVNNDWGRGTVDDFKKMMSEKGVTVGLVEMIDPAAQDMSAQIAKLKSSDSGTVFVTAAVEQLTLFFKQAASLRLGKPVITTGGSQNPDQLIAQAGASANGSMHLTTFTPWVPESTPSPDMTKRYIDQWASKGYSFAGVTESFRGYDGIRTIAAAIEIAKKDEPEAIREGLWKVRINGLVGPIAFAKDGPAGAESGQSRPQFRVIRIDDGKVAVVPEK